MSDRVAITFAASIIFPQSHLNESPFSDLCGRASVRVCVTCASNSARLPRDNAQTGRHIQAFHKLQGDHSRVPSGNA
jgi:hypothetical protein